MKLKELKAYVDKAVATGHGDALVLFDTEARHFQCHVVEVTSAFLEEGVHDEAKIFILYNNTHPHVDSEHHDYLSKKIEAAEAPLLARVKELEELLQLATESLMWIRENTLTRLEACQSMAHHTLRRLKPQAKETA